MSLETELSEHDAKMAKIAAESVKIGIETERERCSAVVDSWVDTGTLKLRAGEMTAQEVRTVKAVLAAIGREIRDPFVQWGGERG